MVELSKNNKGVKLIDENQLVSIFNSDNNLDNKLIAEILNVYLTDIPIISKELEIAFEKKDLATIRYVVHKLTGSLLNLGCVTLVDLCKKIAKSIKKNNLDADTSEMLNELKENITRLVTELYELREKYPVSDKNY